MYWLSFDLFLRGATSEWRPTCRTVIVCVCCCFPTVWRKADCSCYRCWRLLSGEIVKLQHAKLRLAFLFFFKWTRFPACLWVWILFCPFSHSSIYLPWTSVNESTWGMLSGLMFTLSRTVKDEHVNDSCSFTQLRVWLLHC